MPTEDPPTTTPTTSHPRVLCLFDVDGTLTRPRQVIEPHIEDFLHEQLRPKCDGLALVGGSDFAKIAEQMHGADVIERFDHVFAENGLTHYRRGEQMPGEDLVGHVGEEPLQHFINYTLHYLSTVALPVKRGTFVEFRRGMLNISPIGRNCSREERNAFERFDREHSIRKTMIAALNKRWPDIGFTYSIGGQISFDVFPHGWDKTYCLRHLVGAADHYDTIHFFGDKTEPGGNDFELYQHDGVIGHHVDSPEDTVAQLKTLFHIK